MGRRAALALALVACGRSAPPVEPEPHAPALTLAPAATLLALRAANDTAAVRAHAWRQWRDLTRGSAPAWDTWLRSDRVFSGAPLEATAEIAFRPPRPLLQNGVPIDAEPLLYDVLLDREAATFVRERGLAQRAIVRALPGHVPEMPVGAAAIKRVWYPIRRTGLTPLPVWDDAPLRPDADGNPPRTWARVVAVDPSRTEIPDGETADVVFHGREQRAHVVPLARFYHRPLATAGEVLTARAVVDHTASPSGDAAGRWQAPTVDHTASPSGDAAGRGQAPTVDRTASPSGDAAGRGQAPTVDHPASPSGDADGRGQAPTGDHTASPSGDAAGRWQAPTVDHTASPSGDAAGRGQAPTVDHPASPSGDADDPELELDDEVVLVALHLTTKEIPEWTWATWWWHDRADDGPFAAQRPDDVTGWAASYLMDATLSVDAACMNPWLEARFPGGLTSSCATCHRRAAFGVKEFLPVPTATTPADDPYFAGKVTTDFMWSIALEAK